MAGAGSVVTHDVPDYAVVVGNLARVLRYLNGHEPNPSVDVALASSSGSFPEVN
jgi:serine acetyltransferase